MWGELRSKETAILGRSIGVCPRSPLLSHLMMLVWQRAKPCITRVVVAIREAIFAQTNSCGPRLASIKRKGTTPLLLSTGFITPN